MTCLNQSGGGIFGGCLLRKDKLLPAQQRMLRAAASASGKGVILAVTIASLSRGFAPVHRLLPVLAVDQFEKVL